MRTVARKFPDSTSIFQWLGNAVVGGLAGAILVYFSDEIHAYFSYMFLGGNISGEYFVKTFVYEASNDTWKPATTKIDLKHGGTYVFGTEHGTLTTNEWRWEGFFRASALAIAYENKDPAAIGTGTYTLKRDLPYIFWGHWIGVECDSKTHRNFIAQCPAIMFLTKYQQTENNYTEFMSHQCIRVTPETGPCPPKVADAVPTH